MPWLFDYHLYRSPKNGLIHCQRLFGRWTVSVGGTMQTSPYVTAMWQDALERVATTAQEPSRNGGRERQILLLGLGAGGAVPVLRRFYPDARIFAVEWDPVMAVLPERLGIYGPDEAPHLVLGDAYEEVLKLGRSFDLVLFDLFLGSSPDRRCCREPFLGGLARRLAPGGRLVVNAFSCPDVLTSFADRFEKADEWKWRYNRLGVFRHPRGE
jgi:spermidine synthase